MTHERTTPYAAPDPELAAYQRAVELAKAQIAEKDRTIARLQAELKAMHALGALESAQIAAEALDRAARQNAEADGARLRKELEAARAVVAVARAMQEIGDAPFMDELDAYDAIAKAAPSVPVKAHQKTQDER